MAAKFSPKIVIAIGLLLAGLAVLFGVGLKGSLVYYLTVGEFLDRRGDETLGENFRINGLVVEGTLEKPANALGARFRMTDGTRQLPVVYAKETPDTLVDGAEVVVEGALGADGAFVAHTLLAKCPSKYEASNRAEDYRGSGGERPAGAPRSPGASPR